MNIVFPLCFFFDTVTALYELKRGGISVAAEGDVFLVLASRPLPFRS